MRNDEERAVGALIGVAAGDALGATLEFLSRDEVARRYRSDHRSIVGGGAFRWRAGQGTDDSDLTAAVARAYSPSYSVHRVADHMLTWYRSGPQDVGGTTASALAAYAASGDPYRSGEQVWSGHAAGNGSLMRAVPTGIARSDDEVRRAEAAEISRITHSDPRCVDACIAYCDLVSLLIDGMPVAEAIDWVMLHRSLHPEVQSALCVRPSLAVTHLATSGYVVHSLAAAVWAARQNDGFEEPMVALVNLGDDADTTGAIAGGLLGAAYGVGVIPDRWVENLEYAPNFRSAARYLFEMRPSKSRCVG